MKAAFLLAALLPACLGRLHKHLMADKVAGGAVCLDGSPSGFFFANGTGSHTKDWVIYFQGGGWCYDERDCFHRSKTDLGSSLGWGDFVDGDGIRSQNCKDNPAFCEFNWVYVGYCDGNSFSGDRTEPIVVDGAHVWSRGHRIVDAVIDTLYEQYGLRDAESLLVSGCSAGGLAAYLHADYVNARVSALAPGLTRVKAAPVSGFFLDHTNVKGVDVYPTQMKYVFEMTNATNGVNSDCIAAMPAGEEWKCNMAPHTYPYIKTPIMVLNSAMDSWQSTCILGSATVPNFPNQTGAENGLCSAVPGYNKCLRDPETECSAGQVPAVNSYIDSFMASMRAAPTFTKPGNGAFIHSCHLHCESETRAFSRIEIDGVRMRDALALWWRDPVTSPAANHTYLPCHLKEGDVSDRRCNSSCPSDSLPLYVYIVIVSCTCLVTGGLAFLLFSHRHFFALVVVAFLSLPVVCWVCGCPSSPSEEQKKLCPLSKVAWQSPGSVTLNGPVRETPQPLLVF
eukprot:Rhum_TRINITY_DN14421_c0_g1::Rhum_TRINITY_DN14421_c0_g1_i5::g.88020::m.88020/K19882/NOTUM; O-palmitoleoyl-L-serine hydrolase